MDRRDALRLFVGTPIAIGLEALPEVGSVERLHVNPNANDTLVLKVSTPLSGTAVEHIQRVAARAFPGIRVVVLMHDMELQIVCGE